MASSASVNAHIVLLVAAIIGMSPPAAAQIKILTPTSDSCAAFVTALDANQQLFLALSGWAIGYLSGVAQGAGIDFLRNVEPSKAVVLRLLSECRRQPQQPMSVVLQEMSRAMIAGH